MRQTAKAATPSRLFVHQRLTDTVQRDLALPFVHTGR